MKGRTFHYMPFTGFFFLNLIITMCFSKLVLTYVGVLFLISNFCLVLNVVCFLPGNSPAYEFYMSTFRNSLLLHLHRRIGTKNDWVKPNQTEVLTGGKGLREAQVDISLSVSRSCV